MYQNRPGSRKRHRIVLGLAMAVLASVAFAVPASAAGSIVVREKGRFDPAPYTDLNICGWPSTFLQTGEWHYTVVFGDGHRHDLYQESFRWSLTIADDPAVPASVRGVTWRGRNELSGVFTELDGDRVLYHTVQTASEGPFKGLTERVTFRTDADGSILVDRIITNWDVDCTSFA
jgi:hypothetical protein